MNIGRLNLKIMIRIFTDKVYITDEYRKIIFPLLLDLCFLKNLDISKTYRLVDEIEESDIVIVPIDINYFFKNKKTDSLFDFIDKANAYSKKVWLYSGGDFGITLHNNVFTFRLGGFDSKLNKQTFIFPSFVSDPYVALKKTFEPLSKKHLPEIGFVGHASNSLLKWSKELALFLFYNFKRLFKKEHADYQPFYPSASKRYFLLKKITKTPLIITNFILRDHYRAGAKTDEDRERTTLEFLKNINDLPYTFCLRGVGNFSVRFYETLAMGRIPVVVDTDFRLPLGDLINWKNHCLIVSEENIVNELIQFHAQIDEEAFVKMQIENRNLWLNILNRVNYFKVFHDFFKNENKP